MANCTSIDQFKSFLQGGGVRPTMFEVTVTFPPGVVANPSQIAESTRFLIKAATIPESNIGIVPVYFRGRELKVAGDRSFDNWTVTVLNENSFSLRNAFEDWSELIQNHSQACGGGDMDQYYGTGNVTQLDRDGSALRCYKIAGLWPAMIAPIQLDFGQKDTVEEYQITFAYQYWHAAPSQEDITESGMAQTGIANKVLS
jgi:hypothetical protein